jgi:hypothetical protein
MPPNAVKTIRDTIYWQYAKLIAKSAGMNIFASRGFQMQKFKEFQSGKIKWSSTVTEWLRELEKPNQCIYCGSKDKSKLSVEHILPISCGGPDIPDNTILVCKECNSKKGGKKLYEYFKHDKRDEIPRIAEGKYLKLLYQLHEKAGTLDVEEKDLKVKLCPKCDMAKLCKEADKVQELNVYCLEGCWK